MAGFLDNFRKGVLTNLNPVGERLRELSRIGLKYDDMVIRNSRALGVAEDDRGFTFNPMGSDADDMYYAFAALSLTDTNMRKSIAYFDKNYAKRKTDLAKFAMQDEIEDILDTLSDECIVYDEQNIFAHASFLAGDIKDEVKKSLNNNFRKIYNYFGFTDGKSAWDFFRKWLIYGFIAFEIIYDQSEKNIIGFKELKPESLTFAVDAQTNKKIWIQNKGQGAKERILFDSQIIYISYASNNAPSRYSYLERLVRSFNLLRIMEHTRIIWAVTNASYKMKFIIPVGGKSKTRAQQSLAQLMHNYREVVDFDYQSGELAINGKPMMQFNKEYWLPSKDGEEPQIESLGGEGPELSDIETLKYFGDKLKMASKIPFSRFDKDSPAGFEMAADGMLRDEIKFSKFVNRLRSIFQEILVKPLYIQMILDYPELKDDEAFKSAVSIKYNKENLFDEMKNMEIISKRVEFISNLRSQLTEQDENMNEVPYFDLEFSINKYGNFTEEDLAANERYKKIKLYMKMGYSKEDSEKIASGESESKFKKVTPDTTVDTTNSDDIASTDTTDDGTSDTNTTTDEDPENLNV